MNVISNAFLRLIGIHPVSDQEIHSTEELQLLVKQSADSGEIEEENYEIIKNAFDFTDHNAKQVMVPRQNIFSIDIEDPKEEILEKIMESGFTGYMSKPLNARKLQDEVSATLKKCFIFT